MGSSAGRFFAMLSVSFNDSAARRLCCSDLTHLRDRNMLKRNSMRFVAALLAALASLVAGPNMAPAAAPQHHDQVPGFYRLKVGDLEVTALNDGAGAFEPHWLNGKKVMMAHVEEALHE